MIRSLFFATLALIFLSGCAAFQVKTTTINSTDDGIITFKIIQLNDVYEIAPLNNGEYGGMARVAHIRDSIAQRFPNTTLMVLAGDFLNPSLLGSIKYNGERVHGKQMVEVMNAMDFSVVTFGNHEFDLTKDELQLRLNESNFPWISVNVRRPTELGNVPFAKVLPKAVIPVSDTYQYNLEDTDGTKVKVGFFGATIPANPQDYVVYGDVFKESEKAYNFLYDKVDIIIGLTHLNKDQDILLAKMLPQVPLILGGHEHYNMLIDQYDTRITKADANAKTIYIHTLTFYPATKYLRIDSKLFPVDDTIEADPDVEEIVDKWTYILDQELKQVVDKPYEIIYRPNAPLDGTDAANRSVQTNLGDIITRGMAAAYPANIDAAFVNGGSFRLDDMLNGPISSVDLFRVLPFGGNVVKVEMKGSLLNEILEYGKKQIGTGAYLQRYNISEGSKGWLINNKYIKDDTVYRIALSDYLLKGLDIPFLTPENKGIIKIERPLESERAFDIRKAVILYLKELQK